MRLPLLVAAGLVYCLCGTPARADARANVNASGQTFSSAQGGGSARVTFDDSAEGELAVTGRKKRWTLKLKRLVLRNFDFLPDEDGDLLVAVLKGSYLGQYRDYGTDPDALLFIHEGTIAKSYSYSTLLKDQDKAWQSVSHTHWLFDQPHADFVAKTFTLATNDGHLYRFALPDGKLTATEAFDPDTEKKKREAKARAPADPTASSFPAWHLSAITASLHEGKLAFKPEPGAAVLISLVHGYNLDTRRPEKWVVVLSHGTSTRAYLLQDGKSPWIEALTPGPLKFEVTRFTLEVQKAGGQTLKFKNNPVAELIGRPEQTLKPVLEATGILDKADISPYL